MGSDKLNKMKDVNVLDQGPLVDVAERGERKREKCIRVIDRKLSKEHLYEHEKQGERRNDTGECKTGNSWWLEEIQGKKT